MARKPREMVITLPPDAQRWVKSQADEVGLDPATWVRMTLVLMSKGRAAGANEAPVQYFTPGWPQDGAPMLPPVAESDLDAIVGEKLAEVSPFEKGVEDGAAHRTAEVRPLHRPPTPFSPQNQPRHLSGL